MTFLKFLVLWAHKRKYDRNYRRISRINHFSLSREEGEAEWRKRWKIGPLPVSPVYYRVYSRYVGKDRDLVPENVSRDFIEPLLNNPLYIPYYSDKNNFERFLPEGYLPRTFLRRVRGEFLDAAYRRVEPDGEFLERLAGESACSSFVLKDTVDSCSGRGVKVFSREEAFSAGLFTREYLEAYGNEFILQEGLVQHPFFGRFNPCSVNTMRLSLYRSVATGESHVTAAVLRIGGAGSRVDNAHAGGRFVGINLDGSLCRTTCDQWGKRQDTHNGIDFSREEFHIPEWDRIVSFAESVGDYLPHMHLIALDIALTEDGRPKLLEYNLSYYSSWLFQFTTGPCFGPWTDEILQYAKEHSGEALYVKKI